MLICEVSCGGLTVALRIENSKVKLYVRNVTRSLEWGHNTLIDEYTFSDFCDSKQDSRLLK